MSKTSFTDSATIQKKKVLILRLLLGFLIIALPVLSIAEFKEGDVVNGIMEIGFSGVLLTSLIFSFKGRYRLASNILVVATYILMAVMSNVMSTPTSMLFFRNITYYLLCMSLAILFSPDVKLALWGALLMIPTQVFFCLTQMMKADLVQSKVISDLITSTFVYVLAGFCLLEYARYDVYAKRELQAEKEKSDEHIGKISDLIAGATANFEAVSNLSERVDGINELIKNSVNSMNDMENRVKLLDEGTEITQGAIDRINDTITDLNNHINTMNTSHKQTGDSVVKMTNAIQSVASSTKAEQELLKTLAATSTDGRKQLSSLIENIQEVEESISSIQGMLAVIDNIASQTNLLAMNAAIEAAHAGNVGKGFAVVAEEIRKLADNSAKNSREINEHLRNVTDHISSVSEESTKTDGSFKHIEEKINLSVQSFEEITKTTEDLSDDANNALNQIKLLDESSKMLKTSGKEITEAQVKLQETQNQLKDSLVQLNEDAALVQEKNDAVVKELEIVSEISEQGKQQAEKLHNYAQ